MVNNGDFMSLAAILAVTIVPMVMFYYTGDYIIVLFEIVFLTGLVRIFVWEEVASLWKSLRRKLAS